MSAHPAAWTEAPAELLVIDGIRSELSRWRKLPNTLQVANTKDLLSPPAERILGPEGLSRFQEFAQYEDGWDFGAGSAMSLHSAQRLDEFVRTYPGFSCPPSLFMDPSGNLRLGWEDEGGQTIEIEFQPGVFCLYMEASQEEIAFKLDELDALLHYMDVAVAHGAR
jgi:hypothetical protein